MFFISNKSKKNIILILGSLFSVVLGVFILGNSGRTADDKSDAIGVRVIPNPMHYSPARWYQMNIKIKGTPQSMTVDGYEAVRDGRTVYVNAANIDNNKFFTNIYLISYNQDSAINTLDIFGQILSHWKFNVNINDMGVCGTNSSVNCDSNNFCPPNDFCVSPKAKFIRDTKRLADIREIKIVLDNFRDANGKLPSLSAGTYLTGRSLSVWPSWQSALGQELGITVPLDPINKLGSCPGFNEKTCWNEQTKRFADPTPGDRTFDLPPNSFVLVYNASSTNLEQSVCGFMENSSYISADDGACLKSNSNNHAPVFGRANLPKAYSGHPYTGYVEASDADSDHLSWSIDPSGDYWSNALWSGAFSFENTPSPNQKKITAAMVGRGGTYKFRIILNDGKGAGNSTTSKEFSIVVDNRGPQISNIRSFTGPASSTLNINHVFLSAKEEAARTPLHSQLVHGDLPYLLAIDNRPNQDLSDFFLSGKLDPSRVQISDQLRLDYTINILNKYDASSQADFNVTFINHPPEVRLSCLTDQNMRINSNNDPTNQKIRINSAVNCTISITDPDANALRPMAVAGPLPRGLESNPTNNTISGHADERGIFNIVVKDQDEFGAEGRAELHLEVQYYCGDGLRQNPNDERSGGTDNQGHEACDGNDNVASSPLESSQDKQYGCTNTCTFNGGWCGDGEVEANHETCDDAETEEHFRARTGKNSPADWQGYKAACHNCALGCQNNQRANLLGKGCYLDANGNGVLDDNECQKGKYICDNNNVVCEDVFNHDMWDWCCRKLSLHENIDPQTVFKDSYVIYPTLNNSNNNPLYMIFPYDFATGGMTNFEYSTAISEGCQGQSASYCYMTDKYYDCDSVCRNRGKTCIGVGLGETDRADNNCVYITHDIASRCDSTLNQTNVDCRKTFGYKINAPNSQGIYDADCEIHNYTDNREYYYWVGTTACYCK